jgi:hypothetical protein
MKFDTRDLQIVLFSSCEFRENQYRERHSLLREVYVLTSVLYVFTVRFW